jgi:hypothetical protein
MVTTNGSGDVNFIATFPASVSAGDVITATATNQSTGDTSEFSECVTVVGCGGNQPPEADAGPDQTVDEGAMVMLDGTGSSDPDSGFAYQWTQTGGPAVTLTGAATAMPTFTAPNVPEARCVSLTFQLKVTDPCGAMDTDTVVVRVADVFVLQDDRSGYCLRLNACTGIYTFVAGLSTFTGPVVITRSASRVNFQSASADPNYLTGSADLATRRGNLRYQVPRGGSTLYNIFDPNFDNNGPCP